MLPAHVVIESLQYWKQLRISSTTPPKYAEGLLEAKHKVIIIFVHYNAKNKTKQKNKQTNKKQDKGSNF